MPLTALQRLQDPLVPTEQTGRGLNIVAAQPGLELPDCSFRLIVIIPKYPVVTSGMFTQRPRFHEAALDMNAVEFKKEIERNGNPG